MYKSFAKRGKLIAAVVLAVGMVVTNTGCSASIGDLVDAVASRNESVEEVTVKSVSKMLDAIKPNADIVLKEGEYNFTNELKELYGSDGNEFNKSHEYVKIEATEDGYQIIIENVKNLTIESKKNAEVKFSNISSSAKIFSFVDCENITLMNFTVAHTRNKDNMTGEVMAFKNCEKVELSGVNLTGANGYGITLNNVNEVKINYGEITKCKAGAISTVKCTDVNVLKCKFSENEGTILNVSNSDIKFDNCEFTGSVIGKEFISQGAGNSVEFEECVFGESETVAVNSGEVTGDEGYTFADSCTFADISNYGVGSGSNYEEYVVSGIKEFLECVGPNRTIRFTAGEYDLNDSMLDIRNPEEWSEEYKYFSIWEYSHYYEIEITECENLTIVGEGSYNDHQVKFISSSAGHGATLCFSECDNIKIQNIEFEDNTSTTSYDSFFQLYFCSGGEISGVKCSDKNGTAMQCLYCQGDWYIYDSEFVGSLEGPVELSTASGNWYFDGCTFIDNMAGINFDMEWYSRFVSFKYCHFGYVEWRSVDIDDDNVLVANCTHDEVSLEYTL